MDAPALLPAAIGRYEIVRLLGRGAMGRVLLAHDPVLDRQVAIKLLRDDLKLPPEQLAGLIDRMRQEARASARVAHPHIVALFDMGEDEELGLYLVFEYAEGITLKERLTKGPLASRAAAALARQMGEALTVAHDNGVLHRDIKPENVILTATGGKVADFGIARVPNSTLTANGVLLGTPAYSAPESVADGSFSPASDQFSMAATLYEAISQSRAFPGADAVTVAARIASEEPSPIALACGLSVHVDEVLRRGMHKNPKLRYESAQKFGSALGDSLELLPRSQLPTLPDSHHSLASRPHEPDSRAQRLGVGGLFLGALIGAGTLQLTSGLRHSESLDAASEAQAAPEPSSTVAHGFLAEAPKPTSKPAPSARASAARNERGERTDAGAPRALLDAGAASAESDAGSAELAP